MRTSAQNAGRAQGVARPACGFAIRLRFGVGEVPKALRRPELTLPTCGIDARRGYSQLSRPAHSRPAMRPTHQFSDPLPPVMA